MQRRRQSGSVTCRVMEAPLKTFTSSSRSCFQTIVRQFMGLTEQNCLAKMRIYLLLVRKVRGSWTLKIGTLIRIAPTLIIRQII